MTRGRHSLINAKGKTPSDSSQGSPGCSIVLFQDEIDDASLASLCPTKSGTGRSDHGLEEQDAEAGSLS